MQPPTTTRRSPWLMTQIEARAVTREVQRLRLREALNTNAAAYGQVGGGMLILTVLQAMGLWLFVCLAFVGGMAGAAVFGLVTGL